MLVLIAVANGESPLRSTCRSAILVCPKLAPCLGVPEHRGEQGVEVDERLLDPGQQLVRWVKLTRWARSTEANCRVWPWVNSRKNWPNVADAYPSAKSRSIPPARMTSKSSMLVAPTAIRR